MIGLPALYALAGLVFGSWAVATLLDRQHPKRLLGAAFWALLAAEFLTGDVLGDMGNGVLLLALVALALLGAPGKGQPATSTAPQRAASTARHGNRLFLPALIMPGVALAGTFLFPRLGQLVDQRREFHGVADTDASSLPHDGVAAVTDAEGDPVVARHVPGQHR